MPWYKKLLFYLWPQFTLRFFAKRIGLSNASFDAVERLFGLGQRVDIYPIVTNYRGFIIVIDLKLAMFFHQDGEQFVFDGLELGVYEKGDVTILDPLKAVSE